MIDIDKYIDAMKHMHKEQLINNLIIFAKVENKLEELCPDAYQDYLKCSTIVAKDESIELLKRLGANDDEVAEFTREIEEE